MPIYEYQCQKCEQHFEEILPNSAAAAVHCPLCGAENVTRLLSLFGVGQTTSGAGATAKMESGHGCGCGGCTCGQG